MGIVGEEIHVDFEGASVDTSTEVLSYSPIFGQISG